MFIFESFFIPREYLNGINPSSIFLYLSVLVIVPAAFLLIEVDPFEDALTS
jgi:hypothetical protein